MKIATSILAALLLTSSLGASSTAAAENIPSKTELIPGAYCHMEFPAIQGRTLATNDPVLKNQNTGDVIDFYGPCDESPVGQDQVQAQRQDRERRFEQQFSD
jgi:hypothetical protein